jgi:hypothetical protein
MTTLDIIFLVLTIGIYLMFVAWLSLFDEKRLERRS